MPASAPKSRGPLRLLTKVLKVILFPFLFMVNPKIYLTDDEETRED
jgi:hypothetical protein